MPLRARHFVRSPERQHGISIILLLVVEALALLLHGRAVERVAQHGPLQLRCNLCALNPTAQAKTTNPELRSMAPKLNCHSEPSCTSGSRSKTGFAEASMGTFGV